MFTLKEINFLEKKFLELIDCTRTPHPSISQYLPVSPSISQYLLVATLDGFGRRLPGCHSVEVL